MSGSSVKFASHGAYQSATSEFRESGRADSSLFAQADFTHNGAPAPLIPLDWCRSAKNGGVSLGIVGKAAAFLLQKVLTITCLLTGRATHLNRLWCERRAMGPGRQLQANSLDRTFDATLDRLSNNRKEPSWWRRIVLTAEGDYILPYKNIDPHLLRIPSIRDWLSDCYVRADFKTLAQEKLATGLADNGPARDRLARSYARYTFDHPALANVAIDTVLLGLAESVLSELHPSELIVVDLMRESNLRINSANAEIMHAIQRPQKAISQGLELENGSTTTLQSLCRTHSRSQFS
jgi:hypothetical protein